MAAVNDTVPEASLVNVPAPEITPLTIELPVLLKINAVLFTTLPEPKAPVAPPAPTCKVPALILVVPLLVLVLVNDKVPVPNLVKPPLPEMTPEIVLLLLLVSTIRLLIPEALELTETAPAPDISLSVVPAVRVALGKA